jgi:hypothetical protein
MRYVLPVTAVLSVIWSLLAFLLPSGSAGLTDFQMGEFGGRGFVYIWVAGIGVWLILKFAQRK